MMSQWLQGRRNPGNEAEAAVREILAAVREREGQTQETEAEKTGKQN